MLIRTSLLAAAMSALGIAAGGCAGLEERPTRVGIETRAITLERSYTARADCSIAARDQIAPGWYAEACAYVSLTPCVIKMEPGASDATLGHEVRHCFDGAWHR